MIRRWFGTCAVMLLAASALACASAPRHPGVARDYAYARARDSVVVAVSADGRSDDEVQRALQGAVVAAAAAERCEPVSLSRRGDADPRLDPRALAYLPSPHVIAVAACVGPVARLRASDLRTLRWIAGTWRGTGDAQPAFYERYRFLDDSTLLVESFRDSTLADVTQRTRYELRAGRFANAVAEGVTGPRWIAVRLERGAITFAPWRRAQNRFTWRPVSTDEWIADLQWPATPSAPERTRTYRMVRWPTTDR